MTSRTMPALIIDGNTVAADPREAVYAGDVDAAAVLDIVGVVTPVPGGVGPMTIALLLRNIVDAARPRAAA
ncbi:MAG TPA: hypothetical protein VFE65_05105 [Pseudonocardia sp.]|jgi:methylenetetrahydrofolate dehydrogenase (NADP+)/methenyltetrahydrofolate cyclohydrolase|nr:hypothetical protein [Pseudonocardia sp.]